VLGIAWIAGRGKPEVPRFHVVIFDGVAIEWGGLQRQLSPASDKAMYTQCRVWQFPRILWT